MRVIGGQYKGRRLATGVPAGVRPTSDRLREALYNLLGDSVRDTVWLDLFAGSGAVSIEALSRGARLVILNDHHPESVRLLKKNLKMCGIEEGFQVYQQDAFALLRMLNSPPLDFVFLDPPYDFGRQAKLLTRLCALPSLRGETTVILEAFKKVKPDFLPAGWSVTRTLLHGNNQLIFIQPGLAGLGRQHLNKPNKFS